MRGMDNEGEPLFLSFLFKVDVSVIFKRLLIKLPVGNNTSP